MKRYQHCTGFSALNSRCGPRPIPSRLLPSPPHPLPTEAPWGDAALGKGDRPLGTPVWGRRSQAGPARLAEGHACGVARS